MPVDLAEFESVYDDLRRIAAFHMRREHSQHTLQATALVHEAFLRLAKTRSIKYSTKGDLISLAVATMRHVLVDHARNRLSNKRGGDRVRIPLEEACIYRNSDWDKLLLLDRALTDLAGEHALPAQVLELRMFGGFSEREIADLIGRDIRSVRRYWKTAEVFLSQYLLPSGVS